MSRSPEPPQRFDPWAPRDRGKTLRFFAASTGVHAVLLVLFATVTIQIVRQVEKIQVQVEESPFGDEDFDAAPSLEDLAGALKVSRATARQARPAGPRIEHVRAPELPHLGGIGPRLGRGGPVVEGAPPLSFGSGAVGGLGGSFGDYVGGLRKVGLDVALVIDTTESMQFAIDEVKARLAMLVTALQQMVPATRIGIVVYRDHGDDYVVKWTDLSFRTAKLTEFLSHINAAGGGDWEEAVLDGLDAAINDLSWRKKSKRIIVLVGGSPPHAADADAVNALAKRFRSRGGYISTVDVTAQLHEQFDRFMWRSIHGRQPYQPSPMPEHYRETTVSFGAIAKSGGGEMVRLKEEKALIRNVLVLTFGGRWKVEMAKFMKDLS